MSASLVNTCLFNKVALVIFAVLLFLVPSAARAQSVTITSIGDYNMSESESLDIARERAVTNAVHNAAKQVRTYVENYASSHNLSLSQTEIADLSSAILVVKDKQFEQRVTDTGGVYIKVAITCQADVDKIGSLHASFHFGKPEGEETRRESAFSSMQWLEKGLHMYGQGDIDNAIQAFTKVIQLDPKNAKAYNNRSASYQQKGLYDLAISDCNLAIALEPQYANAYINRGNSYQSKRLFDQAIADFTQAIYYAPNDYLAYLNRGIAYLSKQQQFDQAIADIDKSIALMPRNAVAYNSRGVAYEYKADYKQALIDFSQAIVYDAKYFNAYLNRASIYMLQGQYAKAIADYGQAIVINPHSSTIYHLRGYAYKAQGDLNQAIRDFDLAITCDSSNAMAYFNKALVCDQIDRRQEAIAAYQAFLKYADPTHTRNIQHARQRLSTLS